MRTQRQPRRAVRVILLGGGYDDEYEREPAPLVRDLRRAYYAEARMVALIGASTLAPEPTAEDPQQ